jgi:protocatechuate 3,4-dioxygenase alpha subunit
MSMHMTASQTVGPFLHIGMPPAPNMIGAGVTGEKIAIEGRIVDGNGAPVPDGLVEIWQANAHGKYVHPDDTSSLPTEAGFSGFGRAWTEPDGAFRFTTVKPGSVPGPDGAQAPHLMITIFTRGLLKHLTTRMYFEGDPANDSDPVLQQVPLSRRATLMGKQTGDVVRWTVVMQGADETVFFDI